MNSWIAIIIAANGLAVLSTPYQSYDDCKKAEYDFVSKVTEAEGVVSSNCYRMTGQSGPYMFMLPMLGNGGDQEKLPGD